VTATVALFPGLGADQRLFDGQRQVLPDLVVPRWPEPTEGESLADFAGRIAASLQLPEGSHVGGSSFGGMVALELARLVRPQSVFLIGSCRHPGAVRSPSVVAWLGRVLPISAFRPRRWLRPFIFLAFGWPPSATRETLWSMALDASPRFLKWGLQAIASWVPSPVSVPVHHVHGAADRLIPVRRVQADLVVPGAGHLLSMTHVLDVNEFLLSRMTRG
jgi:pimeloyl-ACP methyl ester carboxylesterase